MMGSCLGSMVSLEKAVGVQHGDYQLDQGSCVVSWRFQAALALAL